MRSKGKFNYKKFEHDKELQQFYEFANTKYFDDQLPMVLVGYSSDAQDKDDHGSTLLFTGAKYVQHITVNPYFKDWPKVISITVLHEMCHVKLNCRGGHGPKFKKEIRRLRDMGAFDPYL